MSLSDFDFRPSAFDYRMRRDDMVKDFMPLDVSSMDSSKSACWLDS